MNLMPENISSYGVQIDSLIKSITILVGTFFILAEGVLLYFAFRYRKKGKQKAKYIAGKGWKQLRWVLIPVVIVFFGDLYIDARTSGPWSLIKESVPKGDFNVRVTGQQYSWAFSYPAKGQGFGLDPDHEIQSMGELHVPVDKTVVFQLESRDVLHSFWIPSLRLKQDVVPGRTITGWFKATKVGKYDIACAEICGVGHTAMQATLVVQTQEDFDQWFESMKNSKTMAAENSGVADVITKGHALAQAKACLACHSIDGRRVVGPTWLGLFGSKVHVTTDGKEREIVADEDYIRRSILEPQADIVVGYPPAMPPQRANLTDEEVQQLIDYIKALNTPEKDKEKSP